MSFSPKDSVYVSIDFCNLTFETDHFCPSKIKFFGISLVPLLPNVTISFFPTCSALEKALFSGISAPFVHFFVVGEYFITLLFKVPFTSTPPIKYSSPL